METITDDTKPKLDVVHEHKLLFKGRLNNYFVLGTISQDLSLLKVTLLIEEAASGKRDRIKIDLYERESVRSISEQLAESFSQSPDIIESDLLNLTDLLEQFREKLIDTNKREYQSKRVSITLQPEKQKNVLTSFHRETSLKNWISSLKKPEWSGKKTHENYYSFLPPRIK